MVHGLGCVDHGHLGRQIRFGLDAWTGEKYLAFGLENGDLGVGGGC